MILYFDAYISTPGIQLKTLDMTKLGTEYKKLGSCEIKLNEFEAPIVKYANSIKRDDKAIVKIPDEYLHFLSGCTSLYFGCYVSDPNKADLVREYQGYNAQSNYTGFLSYVFNSQDGILIESQDNLPCVILVNPNATGRKLAYAMQIDTYRGFGCVYDIETNTTIGSGPQLGSFIGLGQSWGSNVAQRAFTIYKVKSELRTCEIFCERHMSSTEKSRYTSIYIGDYDSPLFPAYQEALLEFMEGADVPPEPPEPPESVNPYDPGGNTETGGGDGTFDNSSTPVVVPPLPSVSPIDSGFLTVYTPSPEGLRQISGFMWSSGFDVTLFKKLYADPMDAILGVSLVPVEIPSSPKVVYIGNVKTPYTLAAAKTQFVDVDCGTLDMTKYWGAYLDYSPYTKVDIFLPYIGTRSLDADDVMGQTLQVVYRVDILTGACIAFIICAGTILYTFTGSCSVQIPVTNADMSDVINGALSIATSVGSMIATGGASAPSAIADIASTAINNLKPTVQKSGVMGSSGGLMGVQVPYVIITRPRQAMPKQQNTYTGYPVYATTVLGEMKGYTEVSDIHLNGIVATAEELSEIESLLKGGVIL